MPEFRDLYDLPEDNRIRYIGECAKGNKEVAFMVDKHPSDPGKAERYLAKLQKMFPDLIVINRYDGPVPEVETIKVTRP